MDDDDWFDRAVEEAFDSPQAKMVQQRLAADAAEKARKEREQLEIARRNRIAPSVASKLGSDFKAVADGKVPMVREAPQPMNVPFRGKQAGGSVNRPSAPRPGSTGTISVKLATEAILNHIRGASDPREAASEVLASLTTQIIEVANQADPLND